MQISRSPYPLLTAGDIFWYRPVIHVNKKMVKYKILNTKQENR